MREANQCQVTQKMIAMDNIGGLSVFYQVDALGAVLPAPPINLRSNTINLAIVSPTGGGKTIATKLILAAIGRSPDYLDAEILIFDPKNYEYKSFGQCKNVFLGDAIKAGFDNLLNKFEERLSGGKSSENLLIVVIEEYSALLLSYDTKKEQDKIKSKVTRLLMMGRALNIRLIFIMQSFNSTFFASTGRDNITSRIALGKISAEAKKMLFPGEEVQSMPPRHGYMYLDGQRLSQIIVPTVRQFHKLDQDILKFLKR